MERLQRMLGAGGMGGAAAGGDAPQQDTSEQIYISSLALLINGAAVVGWNKATASWYATPSTSGPVLYISSNDPAATSAAASKDGDAWLRAYGAPVLS